MKDFPYTQQKHHNQYAAPQVRSLSLNGKDTTEDDNFYN